MEDRPGRQRWRKENVYVGKLKKYERPPSSPLVAESCGRLAPEALRPIKLLSSITQDHLFIWPHFIMIYLTSSRYREAEVGRGQSSSPSRRACHDRAIGLHQQDALMTEAYARGSRG
jgi:hypothetical protein